MLTVVSSTKLRATSPQPAASRGFVVQTAATKTHHPQSAEGPILVSRAVGALGAFGGLLLGSNPSGRGIARGRTCPIANAKTLDALAREQRL